MKEHTYTKWILTQLIQVPAKSTQGGETLKQTEYTEKTLAEYTEKTLAEYTEKIFTEYTHKQATQNERTVHTQLEVIFLAHQKTEYNVSVATTSQILDSIEANSQKGKHFAHPG